MLVSNLISKNIIVEDYNVDNITHIPEKVNSSSVYICLQEKENGIKQIKNALKNGAKLIVSTFYKNDKINTLIVDDIRCFYAKISSILYDLKSVKSKIIGVVGTNGKTSTVKMLECLLKNEGKKVGCITTRKAYYLDKEILTDMTTPDPPLLYKTINDMSNASIEYIIMEVSAHAIYYKKCMPIYFEYLIFTNLSQDHLDFFKSYEKYKTVKKSILNKENAKNIVINTDDSLGVEVLQNNNCITYGLTNPADIFAINIKEDKKFTSFILNAYDEIKMVNLKAVGIFNVYNYLSCIGVCLNEGLKLNNLVNSAKEMQIISGRIEYLGNYKGDIYLDYAHTPDGLKRVLITLKKICKGKLICLFGCGGNRDSGKRELMGKISGEYADFSIVTSDNPRYEDPYEIIKNIENGIKKITKNYITIQDRSLAIKYAMDSLNKGDVLVVAGKGDENYLDIMGEKYFYSDRELIKSILEK